MNDPQEFATEGQAKQYAAGSDKRCPLRLGALCFGDACAWFEPGIVKPVFERKNDTSIKNGHFSARHGHCEPSVYVKGVNP